MKMVHNGIEYGDMQLIAETYDLLGRALGHDRARDRPRSSQPGTRGRLSSYLVEITAEVLAVIDRDTGNPLVDMILDTAEQKGNRSLDQPERARAGDTNPDDRCGRAGAIDVLPQGGASRRQSGPDRALQCDSGHSANRQATIDALENALYFAKISSYAQGMALLQAASDEYDWSLDLAEIARIWKGGCIIRAALLDPIRAAFAEHPESPEPADGAAYHRGDQCQLRPSARQAVATRGPDGHSGAGPFRITELCRYLPNRTTTGESDPGAARQLRRAHLPSNSTATGSSTRSGQPAKRSRLDEPQCGMRKHPADFAMAFQKTSRPRSDHDLHEGPACRESICQTRCERA